MKIYWLKLVTLLLLLSACSNDATDAPHITLGLASVANKGAPELAQNLFPEHAESWDRVPIHWNEIQLAPDAPWDWSSVDALLGGSNEPLERVLAVLTGRPMDISLWHNPENGYLAPVDIDPGCARDFLDNMRADAYCVRFKGLEEPIYVNGEINPANPWACYVHQVASKYGDQIDAWQIFNELDWIISSNWDFRSNQVLADGSGYEYWIAPEHFLDVAEVAYQVISQGDNEGDEIILGSPIEHHARAIIGAGDAAWPEEWKQKWYERLLQKLPEHPVAAHLDALGLHVYNNPARVYDYVAAVQRLSALNVPIWFTESGWINVSGETFPTCNSPLDPQSCAADNWAAAYLFQQYAYATLTLQQLGIPGGRIFHFSFRDNYEGPQWVEGLVENVEGAGQVRPSYFAFKFIQAELGALVFEDWEQDERGFSVMRFRRQADQARVSVVWNHGATGIEKARVSLDGARCVRLYDQRGVQINRQGQPDDDCIRTWGSLVLPWLPPGKRGAAGEMMLGGPTFILIE